MKKIILLEDREPRQEIFLKESKIQLDRLKEFIDMKTGEESKNIFKKISADGKSIYELFKNYEIIIAHKSGLVENKIYNNIITYFTHIKHKKLVIFSGGIADSIYTDRPFICLQLNSKSIYSNNLLEFSKNINTDINYLAYGKKWKLNYMVRLANLYKLKDYAELNIDNDEISELEKLLECTPHNIISVIKNELGV